MDGKEEVILVPSWGQAAAPGLQVDRRQGPADRRDAQEITLLHLLLAEITKPSFDRDAVLDLIVKATRVLTSASGAAIALAEEGRVVCCATNGPAAPALGAGVEGGLSRLCLRSGQMQRCDDAESDARVNQESCKQLGIRSLCVLPLVKHGTTVGILEVLSSRACAFRERDTAVLERMANLVLLAISRARDIKARSLRHERRRKSLLRPVFTFLAATAFILVAGGLLWVVWTAR